MILHHSTIELQGKRVFERLKFKNIGSVPKVLENEACFMFLLSGDINVYAPTHVNALGRNDCLLSQCGSYIYEEVPRPQEEAPIVDMVGIFFHLDLLKTLFETSPLPANPKSYLAYRMKENIALMHYKQSLVHYMEHPETFSKEMQWLKLKEILLILAQTEEAPTVAHLLSALFTPREYDFREVIRRHRFNRLSLEQLASLCNMSLATFKRHFQNIYETTPANYFREQRLTNAEAMLRTQDASIADIAMASGFDSIATFNRQFKERFGKSPSAYRLS
jgi:AraC family transcriptional regulator, exoenzyme S synthesis regulatory protein ExsA